MASITPNQIATCSLFEHLAADTWQRLMYGIALACSQSENTITDLNLLEICRANLPHLRVYKARGRDEPKNGFDWEWFIGNQKNGWYRFSVQAKKLYDQKRKYSSLRH